MVVRGPHTAGLPGPVTLQRAVDPAAARPRGGEGLEVGPAVTALHLQGAAEEEKAEHHKTLEIHLGSDLVQELSPS